MGRELPILFNTEMVRAIMEGRKTVTRRLAKGVYLYSEFGAFATEIKGEEVGPISPEKIVEIKSPYQVGDILYIRETWNVCNMWSTGNRVTFVYRADEDEEKSARTITVSDKMFDKFGELLHGSSPEWRPSIHMPKEAARIFLKVTDVRIEQLQEITEEQAIKEGVVTESLFEGGEKLPALHWFEALWNSTIKGPDTEKYGWNANPWVWVIEFERCEKPEDGNE